ncbi:ectoine/hydroxyectoine ABC transporter substrate-binding protein EhuB [Falsiroseomonas oryzae]|uniref:ectoine/hydroxyectoine ABC transporter substrate-binding protein EhuB n=1 Tax=Falsiroseomonas oryzae TaxID=2766473 RepID=UPI0022EACEB4|nr:ectoine/hydroxyectoine ABC transporter substrate-binding protein EhuB [Roseomonas sp. MO-31]
MRHNRFDRALSRRGALGLAGGAALAWPALAQTLERATREGAIRVGFPNQVPYAYATPEGRLTGTDAEVARKIVAAMGIPAMDGVLTEFASLIPGLQAGRFDIVLAMFVNPQRCAQVLFSEPIYGIGQSLIVPAGNPKNIRSYDDVVTRQDIRFAVMAGAVQRSYARDLGIADARVQQFPDGMAAVAALRAGRADVFGISSLAAAQLIEAAGPQGGVERIALSPDPVIGGRPARGHGAFAFRRADAALRDRFNEALRGFLASPDHLATLRPFGLTEENMPTLTTAELCAPTPSR